ncbi:hypothetical protein AYO38_01315 [bacterium SCGC AG-212-C10]|nr:hypothetical protein AYO38_01315 [bacterium SCGC AG-212-C10]
MLTKITLTADKELIAAARAAAEERGTTLEEQAKAWLVEYSHGMPISPSSGLGDAWNEQLTLESDPSLFAAACAHAHAGQETLHEAFQHWLETFARRQRLASAKAFLDVLRTYAGTDGRRFSREEMNER